MELKTINGRLRMDGAFKLVATGYLIGAGVIFVPMFALVTLIMLTSGVPMKVNGQIVEGSFGPAFALMPLIMLPFILAMQSVMIGGAVVLGLWLYQKRRPLRVIVEGASD